jgi:hypothetical protein
LKQVCEDEVNQKLYFLAFRADLIGFSVNPLGGILQIRKIMVIFATLYLLGNKTIL